MSTPQLDKTYNWNKLEERWYQHWLDSNYFQGKTGSKKESYSIVIPPPNVTGILTMGHVLNNTIQDYISSCCMINKYNFLVWNRIFLNFKEYSLKSN